MGAASGRMVLVDRATFLGPPEATPGVSLCGAFYGPCVSPPPHLDGCVLVDEITLLPLLSPSYFNRNKGRLGWLYSRPK
ncbi:hypothetical protein BHM03_00027618 [Ensete ventricosum]|nr:hypothetical protein BHM03_00027618 [Ensete ventricosum]